MKSAPVFDKLRVLPIPRLPSHVPNLVGMARNPEQTKPA